MGHIVVNFAEAGDRSRKNVDRTLAKARSLRRDLIVSGLPTEDPETGVWSGDLAKAIGYVDEIMSMLQEQRSRNRESFMGKVKKAG